MALRPVRRCSFAAYRVGAQRNAFEVLHQVPLLLTPAIRRANHTKDRQDVVDWRWAIAAPWTQADRC